MRPFEEQDRFELPLTPESVVLDVGAHEGNFAAIIHQRHGCRVEAFEPVPEFYNRCARRFSGHPKIRLWPFGLGSFDRSTPFGVKGDMSGQFCTSPNQVEHVPIRDILSVIADLHIDRVALLKLNCEGGEYEILEHLLDHGIADHFDHLSVQFHTVVPDYAQRHETIRSRLSATHDLVYDSPFIWTGWSLRR